jgi:hypothetical protein
MEIRKINSLFTRRMRRFAYGKRGHDTWDNATIRRGVVRICLSALLIGAQGAREAPSIFY